MCAVLNSLELLDRYVLFLQSNGIIKYQGKTVIQQAAQDFQCTYLVLNCRTTKKGLMPSSYKWPDSQCK